MADDSRIRQIVREELARQQQSARFNLNVNPNIRHTGIDSAPINSGNLAPGLKTSGSVTFSSVKDYTFYVNFRPSLVLFYGTVTDNVSGGAGFRSLTIGQAALGQNLYFQPVYKGGVKSTDSTGVGGKFEIVQSCSSLVNVGSNPALHYAPIGEEHIIDVWTTDSTNPQARATVSGYGQNFFTITVSNLTSGYSIVGNYFVS